MKLALYDYFYFPLVCSVFGSFFIMISHKVLQRNRPEHRIIFFLALSDFFASTMWMSAYLIDVKSNEIGCKMQAFGLEFFFTASWMWPLIFSLRLYVNLILERDFDNFVLFHIASWGIPIVFCIICFARHAFGPAGLWCWITDRIDMFALGLGLLVVTWLVEIFVFVRITFALRKHHTTFGPVEEMKRKATQKFRLFLLVPVLCWSWALADRITEVAHDDKPVTWLQMCHGLFAGSQGLVNAIVYGWDEEIKRGWSKILFGKTKDYTPLSLNTGEEVYSSPVDFNQSQYDIRD